MNTIEILINYSKLRTVQNLVYNIDLVTDIIKDDVYKIAKSKRIYFLTFSKKSKNQILHSTNPFIKGF